MHEKDAEILGETAASKTLTWNVQEEPRIFFHVRREGVIKDWWGYTRRARHSFQRFPLANDGRKRGIKNSHCSGPKHFKCVFKKEHVLETFFRGKAKLSQLTLGEGCICFSYYYHQWTASSDLREEALIWLTVWGSIAHPGEEGIVEAADHIVLAVRKQRVYRK